MKNKFTKIALFLLFCQAFTTNAQNYLTGISSKWDDSFIEWTIYTDDEDTEGELTMRWISQNDFTHWDYDLNDEYGRIDVRFRDDLSTWKITSNGEIISAKTRWPNDPREWRITDNDITIILKQRYSNRKDEWFVDSEEHGTFVIYTEYQKDARDWIIEDYLEEDISMPMKMAVTFLAVFHGAPRL